jgi:hypothetical protein
VNKGPLQGSSCFVPGDDAIMITLPHVTHVKNKEKK